MGASPVPVQMWHGGRAQSRCRCGMGGRAQSRRRSFPTSAGRPATRSAGPRSCNCPLGRAPLQPEAGLRARSVPYESGLRGAICVQRCRAAVLRCRRCSAEAENAHVCAGTASVGGVRGRTLKRVNKRVASAPHRAIMSSGATPLCFDLLIFSHTSSTPALPWCPVVSDTRRGLFLGYK